jgi:hypothetical protein
MAILYRHGTTGILPCWPPLENHAVLATTAVSSTKDGAKMNNTHFVKDRRLSWSWKQSNNTTTVKLTTLPPFYVLERSSMIVRQPLQQVLERIDNFLRLKSIVSVLHHDPGLPNL